MKQKAGAGDVSAVKKVSVVQFKAGLQLLYQKFVCF